MQKMPTRHSCFQTKHVVVSVRAAFQVTLNSDASIARPDRILHKISRLKSLEKTWPFHSQDLPVNSCRIHQRTAQSIQVLISFIISYLYQLFRLFAGNLCTCLQHERVSSHLPAITASLLNCSCSQCAPGYISGLGQSVCQVCQPGTYAALAGSTKYAWHCKLNSCNFSQV
jgi:hypothetical protein